MFRSTIILIVLSLRSTALSACLPASPVEIEKIRGQLEFHLLDSDTAKFRNICRHEMKGAKGENFIAYCGMVNSKNEFGAYGGFKRLWSDGNETRVDNGEQAFDFWYCQMCPAKDVPGIGCKR